MKGIIDDNNVEFDVHFSVSNGEIEYFDVTFFSYWSKVLR